MLKDAAELNKLDPKDDISDLSEQIGQTGYALRALGALLSSSDLWAFSEQSNSLIKGDWNGQASNLRWGLQMLINFCLEEQKRICTEFEDKYKNT